MPESLWRVELHCHTIASPDSLARPEAVVAACRARGIDRIAITEHNNIAGALAVKRLAPDLVIVGEEIKTTKGEVIAWFVTEEIPKGLTPEETIARLRRQGAVISIPHPLDTLRGGSAMGLDNVLTIIDQVDALEVFNARCLRPTDNEAALHLADQLGKLGTAGSDAHTPGEIGTAIMVMPPFHDAGSFRNSLALATIDAHLSSGHVRFYSQFAKRYKRLAALFR